VKLVSVTAAMIKIQILGEVTVSRLVCTSEYLKVSCPFRILGSHTDPTSQRHIVEDRNFHGSDVF